MQRVSMTKQLFAKILKLKHGYVTDLYLVNKDKHNTLVSVTRLRRSGGCTFLPHIAAAELARKTTDIYKQGLTPAGFVIVNEHSSDHGIADEFMSTHELKDQLPPNTLILFPNRYTLELEVYTKSPANNLVKATYIIKEPNEVNS